MRSTAHTSHFIETFMKRLIYVIEPLFKKHEKVVISIIEMFYQFFGTYLLTHVCHQKAEVMSSRISHLT